MRWITLVFFVCTVAATAQNVEIIPLDNNTSSDDFAPSPTNHGRMLVVSSEKSGSQKLYSMERTSNGWTGLQELGGDINDGTQVGAAALTPDGQTIIFSAFEHAAGGNGRTDLYRATKKDGSWGNVQNLGGTVNSSAYDAQPALSTDGRTLIFASDRSGGMGGTDLYVPEWTVNGWSVARPLEGANSSGNEMGPSINADGRTITFASDRSGSTGGFDIYVGRLENGKITAVRSAGAPINTGADELFYNSIPNSNQAFFTRATENGDYDNFTAVPNPFPGDPVTLVEGTVRDAVTKNPVSADMIVTDLTTQKTVAKLRSDDETGKDFVTLPAGHVYSITAKAPGYLFHSERYEVPPNDKGQTITKDIDLSPLAGGGGRLLVFFDYDKSELKSESYPELERVIELMRENTNLRMRFEGHTDDQGAADYNKTLSEKRAKAVSDYIVSGGIASNRVESVGFGKTKPLADGTSEDARALNRRVEMKVLP
jgi:hypothetical protein